MQGGLWSRPPAQIPAIPLTAGQLVSSNTGFFETVSNVSVTANNTLDIPSASVTGSINPRTGLLTIKFKDGKTPLTGYGAVIKPATNGEGYFLTPTNAGQFGLSQ